MDMKFIQYISRMLDAVTAMVRQGPRYMLAMAMALAGCGLIATLLPTATLAITPPFFKPGPDDVSGNDLIVLHEAAPPASVTAGDLRLPSHLAKSMALASAHTGVDLKLLISVAHRESAFKPEARARTSSATGLYQFIDSTWLSAVHDFGARHGMAREAGMITDSGVVKNVAQRVCILGLRKNPDLAAAMAAEMLRRDAQYLEGALSRNPTETDLYAAHFLGVRKAARLAALSQNKPDAAAAKVFPSAARANKSIFYNRSGRRLRSRTVKAVYDRLALPYAEETDVIAQEVKRIFGDVLTTAVPVQGPGNATANANGAG